MSHGFSCPVAGTIRTVRDLSGSRNGFDGLPPRTVRSGSSQLVRQYAQSDGQCGCAIQSHGGSGNNDLRPLLRLNQSARQRTDQVREKSRNSERSARVSSKSLDSRISSGPEQAQSFGRRTASEGSGTPEASCCVVAGRCVSDASAGTFNECVCASHVRPASLGSVASLALLHRIANWRHSSTQEVRPEGASSDRSCGHPEGPRRNAHPLAERTGVTFDRFAASNWRNSLRAGYRRTSNSVAMVTSPSTREIDEAHSQAGRSPYRSDDEVPCPAEDNGNDDVCQAGDHCSAGRTRTQLNEGDSEVHRRSIYGRSVSCSCSFPDGRDAATSGFVADLLCDECDEAPVQCFDCYACFACCECRELNIGGSGPCRRSAPPRALARARAGFSSSVPDVCPACFSVDLLCRSCEQCRDCCACEGGAK